MVDWSTAKEGIVDAALKDSEAFLTATVMVASSADQRSGVVAGMFATASAGIVAGLIGFSAVVDPYNFYAPAVYAAGLSAALFFIIGGIFCIRAAMPVGFHLPGTKPSDWEGDVASGRTLQECQSELIAIRDNAIKNNLQAINDNAWRNKVGACVGIAAPVVGALVWGVTLIFRH